MKESVEKISFVIPCYKSKNTIEGVIDEIIHTMQALLYTYEIILVNDYPYDDTIFKLKELAKMYDFVKVVNLSKNFGQHAAIMAGLSKVSGDIIVCLDDDGQTPANEVGKLLEELDKGYDVVYARYAQKKHSLFRNFGSAVNDFMVRGLLKKPKDLYLSSYFAVRRYIVEEMLNYKNAYPYLIGLILRSTRNISNVDVNHRDREYGKSGYTLSSLLKLWMNGFTAFSVIPLRIATVLGFLVGILGFVGVLYVVINKLLHPEIAIGWSSTISAVLIVGGMNLFMMGMVGEYIGRIYISINSSPQYVIKEVIYFDERTEQKDFRNAQ